MIKGYLYDKTNDEIKKDLKNGAIVTIGIDLKSLLDTIILNEINTKNDPSITIALLKQEIYFLLGKIEVKGEKKE